MEKKVTAHILRHLLDNHFKSKADMARQLGVQLRAVQKTFKNIDNAKAGTIILDKSIHFCVEKHISLDSILENYDSEHEEGVYMDHNGERPAHANLRLTKPNDLNEIGTEMYNSMLLFLQRASSHICPNCHTWCNPWDGKQNAEEKECFIGHMAREIREDLATFYGREGEFE